MTHTKRIRFTKAGGIIIVPMGMHLPHAVKIEKVHTDDAGQIIGDGFSVELPGCSSWRLGEKMSVCLGWSKKATQ
jgi:hypothetical protein